MILTNARFEVQPFYGKLDYGNILVKVDLDNFVYNGDGHRIGLCDIPCEELHIAGYTRHCIKLLSGLVCGVYPMMAGRSKRDETWHRWVSSGAQGPAPQAAHVTPKVRGHVKVEPTYYGRPRGKYKVQIEIVCKAGECKHDLF